MSNEERTNNAERLYDSAKKHLGVNLAPGNEYLGCAISFCAVYNRAFPEKAPLRFVNTTQCYNHFESSPDWEQIDSPEPDCVIVSVTGLIPKGSPLKNGHIGIVGRKQDTNGSLYIMSNSSLGKKWLAEWNIKDWLNYYLGYGKIPTFYFRLK